MDRSLRGQQPRLPLLTQGRSPWSALEVKTVDGRLGVHPWPSYPSSPGPHGSAESQNKIEQGRDMLWWGAARTLLLASQPEAGELPE